MSAEDLTDWFKLTAYFAGECTAEERDALEYWLDASPERQRLVKELRIIWEARSQRPKREYSREAAIAHVMARIRMVGAIPDAKPQSTGLQAIRDGGQERGGFSGQTLRQYVWSTTMAFVLGIMVAVFAWTAGLHHSGPHSAGSGLTYITGNGERATITLPDGGTVMLNVASRLEVPSDYFAGDHTVRLTGEGVFTVQHHAGTPLTVLAGSAAVRVLGTSFLVRKYTTDSAATIAVRDGKVAIRSVILTAAQQVAVGRTGLSRVQVADSTQFNFTRGVLTLDDVLFPEAIVELDRWYDADIRFGDPRLATLRMTVEVGAGSLAELSDNLEHTYKVRVVRNGRVLTLYPGQ